MLVLWGALRRENRFQNASAIEKCPSVNILCKAPQSITDTHRSHTHTHNYIGLISNWISLVPLLTELIVFVEKSTMQGFIIRGIVYRSYC